MFTLQSGQIENALRLSGMPDMSAKEMVQGLANCQAPLQHRGQVTISQPIQNFFPALQPAGPQLSFPSLNVKDITVNIPPWQNIPFTPIPYPEWPEWKNTEFVAPPALVVDGPIQAGPVTSPETNTVNHNSTTIVNEGDLINGGDITNAGDTHLGGDVYIDRRVITQQTVVNKGPVFNDNTVVNRQEVHNEVAHNYYTHNHGPSYHYDETYFDGPNFINGPTTVVGPIIVQGQALNPIPLPVVTDVVWEDDALKVKKRNVFLLAVADAETTTTIIEGTACPE